VSKKTHVHVSDLIGINRLAAHIAAQVTDLAEALHNSIASTPGILNTPIQQYSTVLLASSMKAFAP